MWTGNTDLNVNTIQMISEAVRAGVITTDKLSDSDAHSTGDSGAEHKPEEASPPPLSFSHLLELAMGKVKRGYFLSVPWEWLRCGKDIHEQILLHPGSKCLRTSPFHSSQGNGGYRKAGFCHRKLKHRQTGKH